MQRTGRAGHSAPFSGRASLRSYICASIRSDSTRLHLLRVSFQSTNTLRWDEEEEPKPNVELPLPYVPSGIPHAANEAHMTLRHVLTCGQRR